MGRFGTDHLRRANYICYTEGNVLKGQIAKSDSVTFEPTETEVCIYADIENAIARCQFTKGERVILTLYRKGYNCTTIANEFGVSRQGIQKLFDRAVDKIKEIFTKDCEEHLKSFQLKNTNNKIQM